MLSGPPPYDLLPVEVELAEGMSKDQAGIGQAVERKIKQETGATAKVTLCAPRSLPRTEGKTKRVIRDVKWDV